MRVTVDSSEPLADVLRVVGALYGVSLQQAPAGAEASAATPVTPTASAAPRRAAASRRPAGRRAAAKATAPARSSAVRADTKVIRDWAIAQGLNVRARGQLSKDILEAYRAAATS